MCSHASTAQVKLQISSALASVNGFDKAFVAQQRTCRHYDLVTVLLSYVWLTGFGYGFARALVREGAPYSNPEPSQTSTWLCPTVNGMYRSSC